METRPLLLGHRGARFEKKVEENSLPAFDFALARGCDGFEFDVRLSADGAAVICHDAAAKGQKLKIAESHSQQLGLPFLRDVLMRYRNSAFLDIELKVAGLEKITVDLLRKLPPERGFVASSFLPEVLEVMHGLEAAIPLGLICETPEQLSRWPLLPVEYVMPHCRLVKKDLVSQLKEARKRILVWTVNFPAEIRRLRKWGVDGIISDHPGKLAATLGEK